MAACPPDWAEGPGNRARHTGFRPGGRQGRRSLRRVRPERRGADRDRLVRWWKAPLPRKDAAGDVRGSWSGNACGSDFRKRGGACALGLPGSDGAVRLAVGSGISADGCGSTTSCGASQDSGSGQHPSSHGWRPETGGLPAVSDGPHPAAGFGIKVLCQGDRDTGPADQRPTSCGRPQGLGDASGSHLGLGKPGSCAARGGAPEVTVVASDRVRGSQPGLKPNQRVFEALGAPP